MKTPNQNECTEWKLSAKGNYWRKDHGELLVVGGNDKQGYWAGLNGEFTKGIENLQGAMDFLDYRNK
jgi:hypothetical protein